MYNLLEIKDKYVLTPTHFSGLNPSTSSRNTLLWETESPPGIIRNLRMVPRVEPRNKTVRFLWGPASVSTTMDVSWYLDRYIVKTHFFNVDFLILQACYACFPFSCNKNITTESVCVPSHSLDHPRSVPQ